jgi:hypothetical protein
MAPLEEDMKHPVRTAPDAQARSPGAKAPGPAAAVGQDSNLELRIREAAYYRYLARGAEIGHDMEDWLQAEAALLEKDGPPGPDH